MSDCESSPKRHLSYFEESSSEDFHWASKRGVPIIGLTANAASIQQAACLEAGMNEHIAKPVNRAGLLNLIARWLGQDWAAAAGVMDAEERLSFDPGYIRELEEHLGREEANALIELFHVNLHELLSVIRVSSRWDAVAEAAHSLISLAGPLGYNDLVHHSRNLSESADSVGVDRASLKAKVIEAAAGAVQAIEKHSPRVATSQR